VCLNIFPVPSDRDVALVTTVVLLVPYAGQYTTHFLKEILRVPKEKRLPPQQGRATTFLQPPQLLLAKDRGAEPPTSSSKRGTNPLIGRNDIQDKVPLESEKKVTPGTLPRVQARSRPWQDAGNTIFSGSVRNPSDLSNLLAL
jgi:hypothetical protein